MLSPLSIQQNEWNQKRVEEYNQGHMINDNILNIQSSINGYQQPLFPTYFTNILNDRKITDPHKHEKQQDEMEFLQTTILEDNYKSRNQM